MEVVQRKHLLRSALPVALVGLLVILISTVMVYGQSVFSSKAVHSMFVQYVHVTPTKNGLAKVSSGNDNAGSTGVGSAVLAGDRLQSEMTMISAADKVQ